MELYSPQCVKATMLAAPMTVAAVTGTHTPRHPSRNIERCGLDTGTACGLAAGRMMSPSARCLHRRRAESVSREGLKLCLHRSKKRPPPSNSHR